MVTAGHVLQPHVNNCGVGFAYLLTEINFVEGFLVDLMMRSLTILLDITKDYSYIKVDSQATEKKIKISRVFTRA